MCVGECIGNTLRILFYTVINKLQRFSIENILLDRFQNFGDNLLRYKNITCEQYFILHLRISLALLVNYSKIVNALTFLLMKKRCKKNQEK